MKFELEGIIELTADGEKAKADISRVIDECNKGILKKGAPAEKLSEAAEVTDWKLKGKRIDVHIKSGRYVRAHDALVRLRKAIATELGAKHKIGARDAQITKYMVEIELDSAPERPFTVPFVKSIDFKDKKARIEFEKLTDEQLSANYVDRIVTLVGEKALKQHYEGKAENWELIWKSPQKQPVWDKDPSEEMQALGWIKQGATKGKWFFYPPAAKILRTMEKIAIEEVLRPCGFQEVIESHIIPFDIWIKTGHLVGMPQEIYYVSEPATRDPAAWERFSDWVRITRSVNEEELKKLTKTPAAGICYAQCPMIYWSFEGKTIAKDDLPVLIYDKAAVSNRYESGGRHGIERVDEFHRIEPVFIATPEQTQEIRDKLIKAYSKVFNDVLEIEWRYAEVVPFYMAHAGALGGEEKGKLWKGTYDFEAWLPYRGPRESSEWLEFQNLSVVGTKYSDAFGIKGQTGELWSGCSGIGLERWTAAFLAQKGLDPAKWPKAFRERFGEMPRALKKL